MADVKCNPRSLQGVIKGTNFTISGLENDDTGGLVQQFSLQFQRNFQRIYDLASPIYYHIEGASQGNVTFTKVVGPRGAPKLSCDCEPRTLILDAGNTLCYGESLGLNATYTLLNAMPYALSGQGNSNDFIIIFGITYVFNDIL